MPAKKSKVKAPTTKKQKEVVAMSDDEDISDYSGLDVSESESEDTSTKSSMTEAEIQKMAELAESLTQRIQDKKEDEDDDGPAVIYVGHIPYGFFEEQMTSFFGQFGTVNRLRLARNRKSGRSKHYAFVEFEDREVANIVAQAMNNYMMFGRTLRCEVVAKVHEDMFKRTAPVKIYRTRRIARQEHNKDRTDKQHKRRMKRLLKAEEARRAKLAAQGIDYDFPGYADAAKPTKKRKLNKSKKQKEAVEKPKTKKSKPNKSKKNAKSKKASKTASKGKKGTKRKSKASA